MLLLPPNEFWDVFKKTNGALSTCEAIAIMNLSRQAPNAFHGIALEVGTYHGKSAMAAAVGLDIGEFRLVDPIFSDMELAKEVEARVLLAGPKCNSVVALGGSSLNYIPGFDKYCWVFVDSGDHQELPMQEVRLLEDRIVPMGIVAFHDWNSQFLQVMEAYQYLLSTGKYDPIEIPWEEIINHVRAFDLESGNETWHHTELKFPCFVGALRRKA